jgi:ribosomal protein S18 acetylase RimI-like enzyme
VDDAIFRTATCDDCEKIAALHVEVWRETYRLLAPSSAYEALDESRRQEHWAELLARVPAQSRTVVAETNGCVVAFGHAGPSTHQAFLGSGEILHLYVHQRFQGVGLGRKLLDDLQSFLLSTGHLSIKLAVVVGNDGALQFYERAGGRVVGRYVDGVLWRSENLIVELANPTTHGEPVIERV